MEKCNIVGCEKDVEEISRPMMKSGMYCRKHFFEIYYGEDIIEAAESMSIGSIESEIRAIVTDVREDHNLRNRFATQYENKPIPNENQTYEERND